MKCLFILTDDYPHSGACTSLLNNLFFEGGLIKSIGSVDVLSCTSNLKSDKKENFNGVTVYSSILWSRVSVQTLKSVLFKHPFMAINGIVKKLSAKAESGEFKKADMNSVRDVLKKIKISEYDVIVAVMGSFELAAVAMECKEKNPNIKFIVYQVDPCSTNIAFPETTIMDRQKFEQRLYSVSDAIITTPILLKEALEVYSEEIISKMVPMEFPNVVPMVSDTVETRSKIRCLFTGNIYGNFRNPNYCFRLFDNADSKIEFEMIGSLKQDIKNELKNHRVVFSGSKPLEETRKELLGADVLVNIGNEMLNQVPSKLFEYISYGKPIINICKNRNCPTLPYLERYPYALNIFEEDDIFEEQLNTLNEFILSSYKKRMTSDEIMQVYKTCTPEYCSNQMLEVINGLK